MTVPADFSFSHNKITLHSINMFQKSMTSGRQGVTKSRPRKQLRLHFLLKTMYPPGQR